MASKIDALLQQAKKSKQAAFSLRKASSSQKREVLCALAHHLKARKKQILEANAADIAEAKKRKMSEEMVDRLYLNLESTIHDLLQVSQEEDPIGTLLESRSLPSGISLEKVRVPIGLIGVIYESRPNVTIDVAALCLMSGNAALLRGGKECLRTNQELFHAVSLALEEAGLPEDSISFVASPDREQIKQMLKMAGTIDMIIPRGGKGLHQFCQEESLIPVMTGGIGICHLYADQSCKQEEAIEVIYNAKTQRPAVCNALDTLLVHEAIAPSFLKKVKERLHQVHFVCDEKALPFLEGTLVKEGDWDTEWLSLVLGVRVVPSVDEAIAHIQKHSSGHSDGILSENGEQIAHFLSSIDSAALYVNASTRFTDGAQFGLGAEIAVSTQKLHARGPMGLKELTTYQWIVNGNYAVRH